MNGWWKFHRKMLEHPVWSLPHSQRFVWLTILSRANHTEKDWWNGTERITIPAGSFITSQDHLATLSGATRKQVRDAITALIKLGSIRANVRAKRYTEICVVNWPIYQGEEFEEGQEEGHKRAKQGPSKGHNGRMKEGKKETIVGTDMPTLPLQQNENGNNPIKALVLFWSETFESVNGQKPVINWGKHMRASKTILSSHDMDTAKWMVLQLLKFPPDQAREKGWYDLSVLTGSTGNTILARRS